MDEPTTPDNQEEELTKQNNIDPKYLSNCHDAPVNIVSTDEGTSHYECVVCEISCNFHPKDVQSNANSQLKTTLHRLIIENRNEAGDIPQADQLAMAEEIVQLIQAHKQALLDRLDAEMPKKQIIETRTLPDGTNPVSIDPGEDYKNGYNAAITDQAAVIKRIREELS